MAKDKENNQEKENSKNNDVAAEKSYIVVYKHSGAYELHVGKEFLRFESGKNNPVYPEKYSKSVPESIINHRDFQAAKNYFTIIEK